MSPVIPGKPEETVAGRLAAIAAEIREHPERWTQDAFARTSEGDVVTSDDPDAVCWCAGGLIARAMDGGHALSLAWHAFAGATGRSTPMAFNDTHGRTASEVADAFERAAAIAASVPTGETA
jgi:hypothetical protein